MADDALPSPARPVDHRPVHTAELPDTPQRTRTIPATAWVEAPAELLALGERFGGPGDAVAGDTASFLRRIGPWLLWRAGPARGADASYWTARAADLSEAFTFLLFPDGSGDGVGPSGERHTRFRAWKEDLRDHD
ncbi:hypothetical protein KSP35_23530 [Aquihabitans sp. G128]|uniref:hypothetical protein n=1 Tax=Aquihabitans sp. G128 TaxID=2849779 RepID=UPI001C23764A|nr:hypothetical protein [Aquihabitans sp. G128]QXC61242.1 hypothetical protein KSP35_23530 [Aquihabitans sp. G128]